MGLYGWHPSWAKSRIIAPKIDFLLECPINVFAKDQQIRYEVRVPNPMGCNEMLVYLSVYG